MWEFCLYFEKGQLKYIETLTKHLKRFFKKNRGVVILREEQGQLLIGVECSEKKFIKLYIYIYNYLINIIYSYYKRKFLDNLSSDIFNNEIFEIIIKETLFCFDEEYDKNIIKQNLRLEDAINIEGFYNFKLYELKEKWSKLIKLIKNNYQALNSYVVNLDLTRYLLNELDSKVEKVCLFQEGKKYILKTIDNENLKYKKTNFSKKQNFKELLKSLITLSPKSIILCSDINNEDFSIFKDIFIDKL